MTRLTSLGLLPVLLALSRPAAAQTSRLALLPQMPDGGVSGVTRDAPRPLAPGVASSTWAVSFKADGRDVRAAPRLRLRLTEAEVGRPVRTVAQRQGSSGATKASGPLWHGILWGVLGGVGGFFAGGYTGDVIDRTLNPRNGDPGFAGAIIGSLIGVPVGAFLLAMFGP